MGAGVSTVPEWAGFICCALAALGFGSCMVPVKKFETGDGFFFQFVMSAYRLSSASSLLYIHISVLISYNNLL